LSRSDNRAGARALSFPKSCSTRSIARTGRISSSSNSFNALGEPQDISGWRLDGDADFTFPANTVIPSGGFLVVAQSPADVQAVYGISGVLGPFSSTNSLPNDRGTIQLRHRTGAVFLEVNYDTEAPWPAAADGAGHSLVLARPSFGEGNVQAWAASDSVGGSPGRLDPVSIDPLRNVVINEFLAHTDDPDLDFIELYNHSNQSADISGCYLTDARNTNKFTIPAGTILPPRGFVSFNQNQLGFSLSSGGETIYFRNPRTPACSTRCDSKRRQRRFLGSLSRRRAGLHRTRRQNSGNQQRSVPHPRHRDQRNHVQSDFAEQR
jgi:hypothetical protein